MIRFEIDGTVFEVVTDPQALAHAELLGECDFRFSGDLARELAGVTLEMWTRGGTAIRTTLGDKQEDRTGEPWADGDELLQLEADGGIAALAYLADRGNGPHRFEWDGSGSVFWLFHDVTHAGEDFSADAGERMAYGPPSELTSFEEDCANLEGAKLALAAGVDAEEVFRELIGLRPAFRERFGGDSTAFWDLLSSGEVDAGEYGQEAYRAHVACFAEDCANGADDRDEVDGWEYTPDPVGFPAWAVLLHSDYREEGKGVGLEGLDALAFYAMTCDVSERARELLTCDECGDPKTVDATTCEDCNELGN